MTVTPLPLPGPAEETRTPPHDIAAEQAALGGMLLSAEVIGDVTGLIRTADYYRGAHQVIHGAILRLYNAGQPADAVTVAAELVRSGEIAQAGGHDYLHTLIASVPSAASAGYYARIVREKAILRHIIEAGTRAVQIAYSADGDADETAARAVAEMEAVLPPPADAPRTAERLFDDVVDSLERQQARGIPVPWHDLNEVITGLAPREYVVIGARPSVGKSVIGGQLAAYVSLNLGLPALLCSLEMSAEEIMLRLISAQTGVPLASLVRRELTEDDWDRICRAREKFAQSPLVIDDLPGMTPVRIRARLREMRRAGAPAAILVADYLGLFVSPGADNQQQAVAATSRDLRQIGAEFGIPVVVLAQINRAVEHRTDKRPTMADLRDSGQIEADADIVLLLYRDEMYDPASSSKGEMEVIVDKNRQGARSTVALGFQGEYARCVGLSDKDPR